MSESWLLVKLPLGRFLSPPSDASLRDELVLLLADRGVSEELWISCTTALDVAKHFQDLLRSPHSATPPPADFTLSRDLVLRFFGPYTPKANVATRTRTPGPPPTSAALPRTPSSAARIAASLAAPRAGATPPALGEFDVSILANESFSSTAGGATTEQRQTVSNSASGAVASSAFPPASSLDALRGTLPASGAPQRDALNNNGDSVAGVSGLISAPASPPAPAPASASHADLDVVGLLRRLVAAQTQHQSGASLPTTAASTPSTPPPAPAPVARGTTPAAAMALLQQRSTAAIESTVPDALLEAANGALATLGLTGDSQRLAPPPPTVPPAPHQALLDELPDTVAHALACDWRAALGLREGEPAQRRATASRAEKYALTDLALVATLFEMVGALTQQEQARSACAAAFSTAARRASNSLDSDLGSGAADAAAQARGAALLADGWLPVITAALAERCAERVRLARVDSVAVFLESGARADVRAGVPVALDSLAAARKLRDHRTEQQRAVLRASFLSASHLSPPLSDGADDARPRDNSNNVAGDAAASLTRSTNNNKKRNKKNKNKNTKNSNAKTNTNSTNNNGNSNNSNNNSYNNNNSNNNSSNNAAHAVATRNN